MKISNKIILLITIICINKTSEVWSMHTYKFKTIYNNIDLMKYGRSLHASKWIKNVYLYADKNTPLAKLIRNLWFCRNKDEQLLPTKKGASTALRGETFEQLINHIYTKNIFNEEKMFGKKTFKPNGRDFSYSGGWVQKIAEEKNLKTKKLRALIRKIQEALKNSLNQKDLPNKTEAILWAFFSATDKQAKTSKYKPKTYLNFEKKIKNLNAKEQTNYILQNYDKAIHSIIKRSNMKKLPPQVIQGNYGYQYQTLKTSEPFETCTESTMLDLFSILSYNQKTEEYDETLLPKKIQSGQGFKNLFAVLKSPETINDKDIGQTWMNMVSGRNIGKNEYTRLNCYAKKIPHSDLGYILRPRVKNFINLFNFFYGTKAKKIEDLGDLISYNGRKITFTKQKNNSDDDNIITITIDDQKIPSKYDVKVVLQPFHAYLECKERDIKSMGIYKDEISIILLKKILETKKIHPYIQIITLLASNKILKKITFLNKKSKPLTKNILRHLYYSLALKFPKVKLKVVQNALENNLNFLDDNLMALIYRLTQKIPTGDYYLPVLCKSIICSQIYKKNTFFENFLLKYPSEALNMAPYANEEDDLKLCKWFIENGANINWQDYEWKETSVLMRAVQLKKLKIVQFLLSEPNINVNAKDEDRKTILDHAQTEEIIDLLKKAGAKHSNQIDQSKRPNDQTTSLRDHYHLTLKSLKNSNY